MDEDELRQKLHEAHDFLFGIPPGSGKDAETFAAKLRRMVQTYERLSWLTRMIIWIPTLAAIGVAAITIAGWVGL